MSHSDLLVVRLDRHMDLSCEAVGGKAANLVELLRAGVDVPPALALTVEAHDIFRAGGSFQVPAVARRAIVEAYHQLGRGASVQDQEPLVAIRSSATCEDHRRASFAGQFHSELNCRGEKAVIDGVRRVWRSTFNPRPAEYARRHGIDPAGIRMGVILQQMVPARASGTAFSVCPETGAPAIAIHAVWGLGCGVVDGSVTPDAFILDRENLSIIAQRLGRKTVKIESGGDPVGTIVRPTAVSERERYGLSTEELAAVARATRRLHRHFTRKLGWSHVDLEFAIDSGGKLWLTQARPETAWSRIGPKQAMAVDLTRAASLERVVSAGSTGFPGVVTGTARVVGSVAEAAARVQTGDILVVRATTNVWEGVLLRAGAAVTDEGGATCHTAVVARDFRIPCIVGARDATSLLAAIDNEVVTVDATQGIVWKGAVDPQWITSHGAIHAAIAPDVDAETEDEAWRRIPQGRTGKTVVDPDGRRWMKKPGKKPISVLLQSVFAASYQRSSELLGVQVETRIENGIHLVDFHGLFAWRERLRASPLEFLEGIHEERLRASARFVAASESVGPTPDSLAAWFDALVGFQSFMNLAFTYGIVAESRFIRHLESLAIPSAYLTRVQAAMAASSGQTEAVLAIAEYRDLLDRVRADPRLRAALRDVACGRSMSRLPNSFACALIRYATRFKVLLDVDFTLCQEAACSAVAASLQEDVERIREVHVAQPIPDHSEYFPGDALFHRLARISFEAARLRQDSHHVRVRGIWRFLVALRPVLRRFVSDGVLACEEDGFSWPYERLLEMSSRPSERQTTP